MLRHGANVNKGDKENKTPLYYACKNEDEEAIRYLIEKGADASKESDKGKVLWKDLEEWNNEGIIAIFEEAQKID